MPPIASPDTVRLLALRKSALLYAAPVLVSAAVSVPTRPLKL